MNERMGMGAEAQRVAVGHPQGPQAPFPDVPCHLWPSPGWEQRQELLAEDRIVLQGTWSVPSQALSSALARLIASHPTPHGPAPPWQSPGRRRPLERADNSNSAPAQARRRRVPTPDLPPAGRRCVDQAAAGQPGLCWARPPRPMPLSPMKLTMHAAPLAPRPLLCPPAPAPAARVVGID